MTIDKAIENRTAYLKNSKVPKSSDDYNATLLGIEAMKRVKDGRTKGYDYFQHRLPGETKE